MAVIGMLLGIPEEDQEAVRKRSDANLRTEAGKPMQLAESAISGEAFAQYVDWRTKHPSDDLMTELLGAEFVDETGTTRRLTRQEVLVFVQVLAGAGNETTNRLIGWMGKVLAEHPAQRRELVEDRSLIPDAVEEILRYEPPAPHVSRCLTREVELHGRRVPEGSAVMFLLGSANRDDRKYPNGDRFDLHAHRHAPSAPLLRLGRAHLPRLGAGPGRGAGRVGRDPDALPRVGGGGGRRQVVLDLHGAWLGDLARRHPLSRSAGNRRSPCPPSSPSAGGPSSTGAARPAGPRTWRSPAA
jgi:cytochrome P450